MHVKLCNHLACVCVLTRIDRHDFFQYNYSMCFISIIII